MPQRTNLFQEVVEIIHMHMAEDASVEASAMLTDAVTGYEREVDVVMRSRSAGYELVISVEAVGRGRPATVEWVEQILRKHQNLPTNKLVLVAQGGFSEQARLVAEQGGAVPVSPDNAARDALSDVRALWPKLVTFAPRDWGARFDDDVPKGGWRTEPPPVFADDSSRLANTLHEFVQEMYRKRFPNILEQMGVAAIRGDDTREVQLRLENLRVTLDAVERAVCLANENGRLYSLRCITATGTATIQVSEIKLTHGRLGDLELLFSYGEGTIGGRDTLVLVSAPEGQKEGKMTFRIRPEK